MPPKSIFTQAVHAGERGPRPDYTPAVTPIHNSVVYLYDDVEALHQILAGERPGYVYSRYGSPTNEALEQALATLEEGDNAVAFASGMAAIHAALMATGLQAGDTVVAARDLYGVTYALLQDLLAPRGVRTRFVEIAQTEEVRAILERERPRLLILESMSNPLLVIPDLPPLIAAAHRAGASVIVDNTFATPYLLRPLEHGADYVVHSLTKYLTGHDDVLGGAVITRQARYGEVRRMAELMGAVLGPNEAWLAHRGLKTLALRMRQHCENAAQIASWLEGHPRVAQVYYPGRPSHSQHRIASALFRPNGFGGMIAFEIRPRSGEDTASTAIKVIEQLKLVLPGTTLGCIHSLILHPACTSHRSLSPEERVRWGIGEGLLRLSVGIEDAQEIISDLDQALTGV